MIKINSELYVQLFTFEAHPQMVFSGWVAEFKWFLGVVPYIKYSKKLINGR